MKRVIALCFSSAFLFCALAYTPVCLADEISVGGVPISFTVPKGYIKVEANFFSNKRRAEEEGIMRQAGSRLLALYISEADKKSLDGDPEADLADYLTFICPLGGENQKMSKDDFNRTKQKAIEGLNLVAEHKKASSFDVKDPKTGALKSVATIQQHGVFDETDSSFSSLAEAVFQEQGEKGKKGVMVRSTTIIHQSDKVFGVMYSNTAEKSTDMEAFKKRSKKLLRETGLVK